MKKTNISLICLLLVACASTNIKPFEQAISEQHLHKDEAEMWRVSSLAEEDIALDLDKAKKASEFKEIEIYLSTLLTGMYPVHFKDKPSLIRIRVLPSLEKNAFIMPNGAMYVTTRLLSTIKNEAEIATILAHEFVHFKNRHSLKEKRKAKNTKRLAYTATAVFAILSTNLVENSSSLLQNLSNSSYSRASEKEADTEGFMAVIKMGYEPNAIINTFLTMKNDTDASQKQTSSIFSSHPDMDARLNNYQSLLVDEKIKALSKGTKINKSDYISKVKHALYTDIESLIAKKDYKNAKQLVAYRNASMQNDAYFNYLNARILTKEKGYTDKRHADTIETRLLTSLNLDDNCVQCNKELGLFYRYTNQKSRSIAYLQKYLSLNNNALDASIIQNFINE